VTAGNQFGVTRALRRYWPTHFSVIL